MKSKLIFIRHPETEENLLNIQQLHHTANFTEKGMKQLKAMKEYLTNYKMDFCFSSDSPRCIKTAEELINKSVQCAFIITPLLRDKSNGIFEGLKNSEIDWTEINKQPFETRKAPEGESLKEVKERLLILMNKIICLPETSTVLIIIHNLPISVLIGYLLGYDLEKTIANIKINNCTFSTGELDATEFKIKAINQEILK